MKKLILVLALAIFSFGAVQANGQEYKKVLTEYIKNSGSSASFDMVIDQMTAMMGGQLTDLQKSTIKTLAVDAMIDLMVPIYEKEISLDDLKEINNFYASPAGQRIAAATPAITNASMQIGQQWAGMLQQIIQNVMTE